MKIRRTPQFNTGPEIENFLKSRSWRKSNSRWSDVHGCMIDYYDQSVEDREWRILKDYTSQRQAKEYRSYTKEQDEVFLKRHSGIHGYFPEDPWWNWPSGLQDKLHEIDKKYGYPRRYDPLDAQD